jgi:predicted methyltransferase
MSTAPVLTLSHFEIAPLLAARRSGATAATSSADLGRTRSDVALAADGATFANGAALSWSLAERIAGDPNKCFVVQGGEARELRVFSATTGWVRSLLPTGTAPTTLVGGFTMHRIVGIDPREDTVRKAGGNGPFAGPVLDTATGLGYTAIHAASRAPSVVTVELDPAALELARDNPWSAELFTAANLEQRVGDVAELVHEFADGQFAHVIHDPPSFQLAGHLYSGAFYEQLARITRKGGRVVHYIGDPESPNGARTTRGVVERLRSAGFARVQPNPRAFGVVAVR